MDILGIGASELIFILLIAIIILGPKDMQKAGKTIGRWLNQFVHSDGWKALQRASKEIRNLPTNLMREANIDELQTIDKDIRNNIDLRPKPPVSAPRPSVTPPTPTEPALEPPPVSAPGPAVTPSTAMETAPQPAAENTNTTDVEEQNEKDS